MIENNLTPPPELVDQWMGLLPALAIEAAFQAGADQELEACCEWLNRVGHFVVGGELRAARRPKPLSLKEQALAVLEEEPEDSKELIVFDTDQVNIIRRALEQLDD